MDTTDGNVEQKVKESPESFAAEGKQQEKKKDSPQKKNTLASDKPNFQNSESGQSSSTRESNEQTDRQDFELPQTTSPYHGQLNQQQDQTIQPIQPYSQQSPSQNSNQLAQTNSQNLSEPWKSNQEYPSQPGQLQQQYSFQPRPPYPPNSPQPGQSYPQYYPKPAQPYPSYLPPQPRQNTPNQYSPQAGQTYQQYPSQPGQYTAPPIQYQHVYYNPNQMNPQRTLVIHVSPQPQSAQDTPMARPGVRPSGSEPSMEGWKGFQDKKVRRAFVRKVYIILTFQLLFTMGIIALFVFEPHVKEFIHKNIYLYYVCLAVFIAVYIGLACFQSLRRSFPSNLIALIVFTISMSCMLGIISSFHKTEAVLMAVGICAAICFVVTVFSIFTKIDFTACGAVLCILLLVLILFGFIAIFIPSKIMILIYAGTGATVFTLFLAYDIQMLMGGKTVELNPEEYIFAAVQIYLDVSYIFLYILTIITFCNE